MNKILKSNKKFLWTDFSLLDWHRFKINIGIFKYAPGHLSLNNTLIYDRNGLRSDTRHGHWTGRPPIVLFHFMHITELGSRTRNNVS